MNACVLATLSLVVVSSSAQLPYTEKQVIEYAKSIDVQTLDSSLPSQRLEDWLQSGPPHAQVRWELADTCDIKPDDTDQDYPLCAKVWISRNGQWGFFLLEVGSVHKGITGRPQLYYDVYVWEDVWVMTGSSNKLSDLPALLDQPVITGGVRKMFEEIVVHHPIGPPSDMELLAIRPYLSKRLIVQLQTAQACEEDYVKRRHSLPDATDPLWMKTGLFTGDDRRALPIYSSPVNKEPQKDGTFLVPVDFASQYAKGGPYRGPKWMLADQMWRVVAKVVPEDGHFVVDDVRLFDGSSDSGPSHLLSESFLGCKGSHWIGYPAPDN